LFAVAPSPLSPAASLSHTNAVAGAVPSHKANATARLPVKMRADRPWSLCVGNTKPFGELRLASLCMIVPPKRYGSDAAYAQVGTLQKTVAKVIA
jgi:hypothetical protein